MKEAIYIPRNEMLRDYIQYFWLLESDQSPGSSCPILPAIPEFDLIFSFASSTSFTNGNMIRTPLKGSFICGIRKEYYTLSPTGPISYLGIRFLPTGLYPLLGIPLVEMSNKSIELEALPGREWRELHCRLENAMDTEARLGILENWLITKLMKKKPERPLLLEHSLKLINKSNGGISIKDICGHFDIGYKKLEREFGKRIGVSPKFFSRLVRFNHMMEQLNTIDSFTDWWDMVDNYGYYDQAHMIKEFSNFVGQSPESYRLSITGAQSTASNDNESLKSA